MSVERRLRTPCSVPIASLSGRAEDLGKRAAYACFGLVVVSD